MRRMCSWCGETVEIDGETPSLTTHGICADCARIMLTSLAESLRRAASRDRDASSNGRRTGGRRLLAALALLAASTLPAQRAASVPQTYTDPAAFLAALPGAATTVDFDSIPAGTVVASGSNIAGLTMTYSLGGVSLAVTDGTSFGAAPSTANTTSAPNFIGTNDADHLQDGDILGLSFSAGTGIGLYLLTRDAMENGDIKLIGGGTTASLVSAAVTQTLEDGSQVYFLGILDPDGAIASATVNYTENGETNFLWNADDVIMVPEPAQLLLLLAGAPGLASLVRLRRAARERLNRNPAWRGESAPARRNDDA